MTQPYWPGLPAGPAVAPGLPYAPAAPGAVEGGAAIPTTPEDRIAARAERGRAREEALLREERAQAAEQARLEEEHGKLGVIGTQFARGALDVIMAPAALTGAYLENAGDLFGLEGLEKFGREFGKSAQGSELFATFGAIPSIGDGKKAIDSYEHTQHVIHEQEQAWPMLASVSHLAGSVTAGVGLAAAAAPAGFGAQLGAAAYEGGAYGAQSAYAQNAPLQDVLTSTLIGATVGAGLTYGAHKVGHALTKTSAFRNTADESAAYAIGAAGPELRALGKEKIQEIGHELLRYELQSGPRAGHRILRYGAKAEDMLDDIVTARTELGSALDAARNSMDDAFAPDMKKFFQELDEQTKPLREALHEPTNKLADDVNAQFTSLRKLVDQGKVPSFEQLSKTRTQIGEAIYPRKKPGFGVAAPPPGYDELVKAERLFANYIDDAAERASAATGAGPGGYRALKRQYHLMRQAEDIALKADRTAAGNQTISLGDKVGGLAGTVAGAATGGVGAAATGAASTAAHKLIRERGRSVLALIADAVDVELHGARRGLTAALDDAIGTPGKVAVTVEQAGGKEAHTVISEFEKARIAVREASEKVSQNPVIREQVGLQARKEISERLAAKAGAFDPVTWTTKPPNALQKILYRGQILDKVSDDVSGVAQRIAAAHPSLDIPISADRVTRLLRDADGPAAIGALQSRVKGLLGEIPKSVEGDQMRLALRAVFKRLNTQELPEAFAEAHELVRGLARVASSASDPVTQKFAARASSAIASDIGQGSFGEAGRLYSALVAEPTEGLLALGKRDMVREALRTAEGRGRFGAAAREYQELAERAYQAQSKLSGQVRRAKGLKEFEKLVSKAEEAATLDGGPVKRVLDHFRDKVDNKVAESIGHGAAQGPEQVVSNYVRPRMRSVVRTVKRAVRAGEHGATHQAQHASVESWLDRGGERALGGAASKFLTMEQQRIQYRERLDMVADATMSPDTGALDEGIRALSAVAPGQEGLISEGFGLKLKQLMLDMPKPAQNFRGTAWETLSASDVRLGNAMWEATMEPMSVFDDFEAGTLDYDKVRYAWKQYPGLKLASQMGLMDILHQQLTENERAGMPESLLTQLDYLFDLKGGLQTSIDPGFSSRMGQAAAQYQQQAAQNQQNQELKLASAEPTFTERLSAARR